MSIPVPAIPPSEIVLTFVRASGPGGQNVNKVATAAQLRFDVRASRSIPQDVKARLLALAGVRATADGVIVLTARGHRSQEQNRRDALDRLAELLRRAAVPPKRRRPTKPSAGSRRRRLAAKLARAERKRLRRPPGED